MSHQHKNPTISFRVSDYERKAIEARILANGMMKKDYFVCSYIYNRICVVNKKETIYPWFEVIRKLYFQLCTMHTAFTTDTVEVNTVPAMFSLSIARIPMLQLYWII